MCFGYHGEAEVDWPFEHYSTLTLSHKLVTRAHLPHPEIATEGHALKEVETLITFALLPNTFSLDKPLGHFYMQFQCWLSSPCLCGERLDWAKSPFWSEIDLLRRLVLAWN